MAQPSSQNLIAGLDPTGFTSITPSQLLQLVQAATPYVDKGLVVRTIDVGGVPNVPDAAGTPLWQQYIWVRIMAGGVVVYVWNANGVSDATYQKWVSITVAGIADGSIITSKLADLSVTNGKIVSVDWTKLTGIPALVLTGSAAGGDLAGTYPNPTIAPNIVDRTKLQSDAAVDANRAVGTDHIQDSAVKTAKINDLAVTVAKLALGTAGQILRTNAAGNAVEWASIGLGLFYSTLDGLTLPARDTYRVFAHGLVVIPKNVYITIYCATAELNYSIGDEIPLTSVYGNNINGPFSAYSVSVDPVNIRIVQTTANSPTGAAPYIINKTTAAFTTLTPGNWKLMVRAWI